MTTPCPPPPRRPLPDEARRLLEEIAAGLRGMQSIAHDMVMRTSLPTPSELAAVLTARIYRELLPTTHGGLTAQEFDHVLTTDARAQTMLSILTCGIARDRAQQREAHGWRPVSTLPGDEEPVLVWSPRYVGIESPASAQGATHWMPLPAPPQEGT